MNYMNVNNTLHIINQQYSNLYLTNKDKDESSNIAEIQLSDKEQAQVERLQKEDKRVRIHESAHKAAAGNLAKGSPNYKYKVGHDGKRYAVGGHVNIEISEVPNNPEATIRKAQQIKTAALAPAEPSAQDQKVAAQASQMEAKARKELSQSNDKNILSRENENHRKVNSFHHNEEFTSKIDLRI
jgi:hypothetical protein